MSTTSENNRRIAKNTLLLYFRMLLTMIVSLYTSRVVLEALGVEDYGIYNVVGGVIAMFGFLNSAMASSTQRYITFEFDMEPVMNAISYPWTNGIVEGHVNRLKSKKREMYGRASLNLLRKKVLLSRCG